MRHLRDELAAAGLSPDEAERKSRLLAATRAVLDTRGCLLYTSPSPRDS